MRLGLSLFWGEGLADPVSAAQKAESLGYDSVWTAESYGSDAVVPLSWVGSRTERVRLGTAIMQMPGRTPAMTAMTAAALDRISGGRFMLGLGLSGPQVAEGWHGQPYGKPLGRTREYVDIVRGILRREAPLVHHGGHYDLPYSGPGATGLGKPLKLISSPLRPEVPIYLAALGRRNVALAAEIADGWLPTFFTPASLDDVYRDPLASAASRDLDIAPLVNVVVGDDVTECHNYLRPLLALYVGGMGARGKNFYNELACGYGYEAAAIRIQDLYLDGKKDEAAAAVPSDLVDEVALCGPRERIADQLVRWKDSRITSMIIAANGPACMETMAELVL